MRPDQGSSCSSALNYICRETPWNIQIFFYFPNEDKGRTDLIHPKRIRPVQHIRAMPRGSSRPQKILFSDGRQYIVKFKNNARQGTRALVNEYVAGQLAQLLSLPVPRFKVVDIPKTFIQSNKILSQYAFTPGHQFASEVIHPCEQLPETRPIPKELNIVNRSQCPGIVVFDQWIHNIDRLKRNVLLQPQPRKGGYKLYIIDHGHSFSFETPSHKRRCSWTPYTLKFLPQKIKPNSLYNWIARHARNSDDFFKFVDHIQRIPDERICQIIASIPHDWNVSRGERTALFTYLQRAKKRLPRLIARYLRKS